MESKEWFIVSFAVENPPKTVAMPIVKKTRKEHIFLFAKLL
jgi:hypothetical protein